MTSSFCGLQTVLIHRYSMRLTEQKHTPHCIMVISMLMNSIFLYVLMVRLKFLRKSKHGYL